MNSRLLGAAIGGATIGILAVTAVLVVDHQGSRSATAAPVRPASTSDTTVPASPGAGVPTVSRTITVTGNGSITVKPDTATINLGVQANEPTATAALDQANTAANALLTALKGAGVAADDIVTNGLSVYPMYATSNVISGYQASNNVTVTVHNINHTGPVIDAAAKAAGDHITISGVSFSVGDPEAVIASARAKAIQNATARADQYATAAGVKAGQVLQISEVQVSPVPVYYAAADSAAGGKASAPTPVQTGTQDLSVTITVVFALQ